MAFNISERMKEIAETQKYLFLSHVRDDIKVLHDKGEPITLAFYQTMYLNSWERKYLLPLLDNVAFLYDFTTCLSNIDGPRGEWIEPNVVYNDFVLYEGAPELVKRFVQLSQKYQMLLSEHCQYDDKEKI